MKTIVLDLDDFSILNNRIDLLLKLKESYPKLKVSLFTIPYDFVHEREVSGRLLREQTLASIKKQFDWLEFIPHGLIHFPREFEKCDYETMRKYVIPSIDEAFTKNGLPYVKGFKPPFWLWNKEVVRALDDEGWWGAIDRNNTELLKTKKYYIYSHGIDEPFWCSTNDTLKLHGHIPNVERNGLDRCFVNLFKMPVDAEFKFASEMLES